MQFTHLHPIQRILLFFLVLLMPLSGCKKDEFLTDGDAKLEFSEDKILFDTVFVSVGSITKNLKVYNRNDRPIRTNIRMAGSGINYRMNVNGLPGRDFKNIEIRAKDSLWIFVEVTVDPGSGNLPFIINDSIVFETNGNTQDVDLIAWGQNAHFIVADHDPSGLPAYALMDTALNANITWDSILPYVIYGYAVVDSTQTLTITKGTQVHFYNNSGLWIYKGGTLKVEGTVDQPVVFQGTRRESSFSEEPGQWDRIWLNNGATSTINHAIIKNGFIGLQCDVFPTPVATEQLLLSNTFIRNMSGAGILASNYSIKGWNNVIASCGAYACALTGGGNYDFIHCTFANFWNFKQRSTPSIYINNFLDEGGGTIGIYDLNQADFKNCIIDGTEDDEIGFQLYSGGNTNYFFRNCIIKATQESTSNPVHFNSSICRSCNPNYKDKNIFNYEPGNGSPADNAGDPLFVIADTTFFDIRNKPRDTVTPALGAYEIQP